MAITAQVTVDFTQNCGKIRALNGGNLGPRLYRPDNQLAEFKDLQIPMTRLHDAPLGNYGMRLVDIHQIFGNWKADASNPDNYYFRHTDDYIANILNCGSRVMYRLGTSIEHSTKKYYAFPPEDFEKWTDICINIIRHYNEGWNNGFAWNITHWEIWNEPDGGASMWSSSQEMYFKLYEVASKRIKKRFPKVKVGGPAICWLHGHGDKPFGDEFLSYCRDHDCPVDFYSWHSYERDPVKLGKEPIEARKMLDSYGFPDAELHLDEWHYWHCEDWSKLGHERHRMDSARAAAHAVAALTLFQDTPLTMSEFYSIGYLDWFCPWGAWGTDAAPNKIYRAFEAFSAMLKHANRVVTTSNVSGIQALAGKDEQGEGAILLSDFRTDASEIKLELQGIDGKRLKVLCLDEAHDLVEVPAKLEGKFLILPTPEQESSIYLIHVALSPEIEK